MIRILLFATLRDQIGQRELQITPDGIHTVSDVRHWLRTHYPDAVRHVDNALCAVNEEFANDATLTLDGADVALFPPVSGGEADLPEHYALATESIDHDAIVQSITTLAVGAVVMFTGIVRGVTNQPGHLPATQQLSYEAYTPMALAKMKQVAQEIRARYAEVIGIAIVQRIGLLNAGENTVLIAVSSAHRDDGCFEAARYGIDRLKEIVPVWKQEIGVDGAHWIEGAYHPTASDNAHS